MNTKQNMKPRLNQRKNRAFTLIEIMVVIALIGLSAGALQLGIGIFLKQEAFTAEVGKVKNALILANEFMMDTGSDLTLILLHKEECVTLHFITHAALPDKIKRQFTNLQCKQIKKLYFGKKEKKEIILHFDGHHGRTSEGEIILENQKGEKRSLILRGFPGKVLS